MSDDAKILLAAAIFYAVEGFVVGCLWVLVPRLCRLFGAGEHTERIVHAVVFLVAAIVIYFSLLVGVFACPAMIVIAVSAWVGYYVSEGIWPN